MLLLHQTGAVKVGEVIRYTVTYTPSADRILPPPSHLHVKIKNTSAIPLRAAYLHGPYTLYVACYPSTFDPNQKHINSRQEGSPDFEPNLKAGGHWTAKLTVPEEVREGVGESQSRQSLDGHPRSFTWIIEVSSQVLFSTTASVHFEVLVGRDEKSVDLGFHGAVVSGNGVPGRVEDHQQGRRRSAQPKGVFSKAVRLAVDDTESLWNTPPFPEWNRVGESEQQEGPTHGDKRDAQAKPAKISRQQTKIHLVILTHGLHSNLGADMLYIKESIDTAAKQAREDARQRRAELRRRDLEVKNVYGRDALDQKTKSTPEIAIAPTEEPEENDNDDEQVLVRGFNGNAVKTERGIQYLGKRLAKYVLSITYPDQPYLPVKSSISKSITRSLTGQRNSDTSGQPSHRRSSIVKDEEHTNHNLAYKITSISFISHSLGGLIQTYAIAYIQKHSPDFFDRITPINFVAMASPFLGLSNENPMYVKFALDFGLVGRTGQDLGLTWRTPTIARSGWDAVIGGLGPESRKGQRQPDPGTKPLLRILPTGPAHAALKRFRNRSVYSNVVNDGIVPLRTSCLLFLDWRGLGRVEKARRENGLVGTMVGWGWSEMMGQNASSGKRPIWTELFGESGDERSDASRNASPDPGTEVPQAEAGESLDDDDNRSIPEKDRYLDRKPLQDEAYDREKSKKSSNQQPAGAWAGLLAMFKPQSSSKTHHPKPKNQKIYHRGQTMKLGSQDNTAENEVSAQGSEVGSRRGLVRGASLYTNNSENGELEAPPKTTFFESAGDILNPPLPPKEFLLDPAARPRTIFHDRVYHPEDIPAPPTKRQRMLSKRMGSRDGAVPKQADSDLGQVSNKANDSTEPGGMKIEEKIARAYHKDLSWRKVLVRLEPDAHNNMIVRRMFANAYGWPVVKHLCDTHFAYTAAAQMRDEDELTTERAKPADAKIGSEGEQVTGQVDPPEDDVVASPDTDKARSFDGVRTEITSAAGVSELHKDIEKLRLQERKNSKRSDSEVRESRDEVPDLISAITATGESSYSSMNSGKATLSKMSREDSARWSDRFFEGSEDDTEEDEEYLKEWRKAKARGKVQGSAGGDSRRSKASATTSAKATIVNQPLTASPKQSTLDLKKEMQKQLAEQVEVVREANPQNLSLTGVGLGKSVDEHLASDTGPREATLGVAEQVAFASSKKRQSRESTST